VSIVRDANPAKDGRGGKKGENDKLAKNKRGESFFIRREETFEKGKGKGGGFPKGLARFWQVEKGGVGANHKPKENRLGILKALKVRRVLEGEKKVSRTAQRGTKRHGGE